MELEEGELRRKSYDWSQMSAPPMLGQLLLLITEEGETELHDSQSVIKDPAVSEKHAEFSWEGTAWTLRDLGSSNGTAVNGCRLQGEGAAF